MKKLTPEQIAYDLTRIHHHMPEPTDFMVNNNNKAKAELKKWLPKPGIIYREEDLLKLFRKWGLPKPKWGGKKYLDLFKQLQ